MSSLRRLLCAFALVAPTVLGASTFAVSAATIASEPAPSGLSVGTTTSSTAAISWSDTSAERWYRVFINGSLAIDGVNQRSLQLSYLKPDTSYQVAIAACRRSTSEGRISVACSLPSEATSLRTQPVAVTNLRLSPGSTTLAVSWSASAAAASGTSSVWFRPASSSTWQELTPSQVDVSGEVISGLQNGTAYAVKVRTSFANGYSDSAPVIGTPTGRPVAVTVTYLATSSSSLRLTWSVPSVSGATPSSFEVFRDDVKIGTTTGARTFLVSGLDSSRHYKFHVRACNERGCSEDSEHRDYSHDDDDDAVKAPPTAPVATLVANGILVTWAAPTSVGRRTITDYLVQYSKDNGVTWVTYQDGISTTTATTVTGLTMNATYVFRVAAVASKCQGAWSAKSNPISYKSVPSAPLNVTAAPGLNAATVSWSEPLSNGGSAITNYVTQYSSDNGATWTDITKPVSTLKTLTVSSLQSTLGYIFRVAATNEFGQGPWSASSARVTPTNPKPGVPTSVTGAPGDSSVSLVWVAPVTDGGSPVLDYTLQFSQDNGTTWATFQDGTSTSTSAVVTGLTNGVSYIFRVTASNAYGSSDPSTVSPAYVPFTTPTAPTNVVGIPGADSIALTWVAPLADGGAAITDYVIQYSINNGAAWVDSPSGISISLADTVAGLSNGASYLFRVAAVNKAGIGLWSSPTSSLKPYSAPAAPTNLQASPLDASVALSWSAPAATNGSPISDYLVQFSTDGSNWTTFTHTASTSSSIAVTGLTNGTSYSFKVAAVNQAGAGAFSTPATATPRGLSDAPGNVQATVSGMLVALAWAAPLSDGGAAVTDYTIQYSPNNGTSWVTLNDGLSTALSASTSSLTAGTSYVFQVAAVTAAGRGPWSSSSNSVTPITVASAPRTVSGSATAAGITVVWFAPLTEGGSAVTDYVVQYSSDTGATWSSAPHAASSSTSLLIPGLNPALNYTFRVAAINAAGQSAWSSTSGLVKAIILPDAPSNLLGTAGNVAVTLTWAPPASNGGAPITDYIIQYSSNAGANWVTFSHTASAAASDVVTGLLNGTSYVFRVAAITQAGTGAFSAVSSPVTPRTTPGAPSSVVGSSKDAAIDASWTGPLADGGAAITDYVIQYSSNNGITWVSFSHTASAASSIALTGLSNGSSYLLRVAAVNEAGVGSFSPSSATIKVGGQPADAPTSVTCAAISSGADLTWVAPVNNNGTAISDYAIQYSSNAGTSWLTFSDGTSSNTFASVTSLQNGASYTFKVAAINAAGQSAWSSASSTCIPGGTPSAPTGLTATAGANSVALAWKAPLANGGAVVTDYVVELSADNGTTWSVFADGVSNGLTTTVSGLSAGTSYVFRVSAVNSYGQGAASTSSLPTLVKAVPTAPLTLTATPHNGFVTLSWQAPLDDGGAAITDYVIQSSLNNGTRWDAYTHNAQTSLTIDVRGLTNGRSYIFRIAAVNAAGTGTFTAATGTVVPLASL